MSKSEPKRVDQEHSPIHILYVIDQLCEAGGAERILLKMIQLLPRERFRCSLIAFKIDETLDLFKELPCPHHILPLGRTYDWNALQTARKIRRFIRDEKVRIVHTFHETSDLWGGFVSRMKGGPALVSSRRDLGILRLPKHNLAYRLMNSRFDLVLTVSEEVRHFCIRTDHISENKISTLYNGIELSRISQVNGVENLRSSLEIAPHAPVILTVGHIRRVKGIDVLVETAAKVVPEFPNAVFLVIGRSSDPTHFLQIEARIAQLGIRSNIRFFGESENILSFHKMGDVFFLPSRSEGFSNALIEAMACGLPCVATRVGGNAEAVEDGRSGYLIESEDAASAADRILRLLRDPAAAKEMGVVGRKIVEEKFSAEVMIGQLVQYYDRLLEGRRN
jgi:glycosyltransferase involved in cell wall biosynthesis